MARIASRLHWEVQRALRTLLRRFGVSGLAVVASSLLLAAAWTIDRTQLDETRRLQANAAARGPAVPRAMPTPPRDEDRARLAAFDTFLVPAEDVSSVVGDILREAERRSVSIARGDYRAQSDDTGGFVRYRMSLPVKGEIGAVRRFMQAVLQRHPALALETVQIGRERIEAREVQARVQWSLMVRSATPVSTVLPPTRTAQRGDAR